MNLKENVRFFLPRAFRNFLRAPVRTLKHQALSLKYTIFRNYAVSQIRPEWKIFCHPLCAEFFNSYQLDPESQEEIENFIYYASPGMTLLDIGCHFGLFTLAALHYGGPLSKVIAVDPSLEISLLFLANVKLNHLEERVHFLQAAVGNASKIPMVTTGAFGLYMMAAVLNHPDAQNVRGMTLPEIADAFALNPTHVKIDVEGYEQNVINGAKNYLSKHRPVIFLELHNKLIRNAGQRPQDLLTDLREIRYIFKNKETLLSDETILSRDISRFVCVPQDYQRAAFSV